MLKAISLMAVLAISYPVLAQESSSLLQNAVLNETDPALLQDAMMYTPYYDEASVQAENQAAELILIHGGFGGGGGGGGGHFGGGGGGGGHFGGGGGGGGHFGGGGGGGGHFGGGGHIGGGGHTGSGGSGHTGSGGGHTGGGHVGGNGGSGGGHFGGGGPRAGGRAKGHGRLAGGEGPNGWWWPAWGAYPGAGTCYARDAAGYTYYGDDEDEAMYYCHRYSRIQGCYELGCD